MTKKFLTNKVNPLQRNDVRHLVSKSDGSRPGRGGGDMTDSSPNRGKSAPEGNFPSKH